MIVFGTDLETGNRNTAKNVKYKEVGTKLMALSQTEYFCRVS
jgi:hypothetical protein